MPRPIPAWQLENFLDRFDRWAEQESPSPDLRIAVAAWIFSRYDDPYQGVRREAGFPNLWFGEVPGTRHAGRIVVCSYWIEEAQRTVRCDSFATLSLPI